MAQKRDDYEDEEDDSVSRFAIDKLTIFTALAFIIICELFLHFLKIRTGASYGWVQMAFAIIAGIAITLYLLWTRFIMDSNKYMGAFLSLAGIISVAYALTRKYQGVYTTTFICIGVILALFYTIFYFVKANKK